MSVVLESSWKNRLSEEFEQPYFRDLSRFIRDEYSRAHVYPPPKIILRALDCCPFEKVRVVILGQDPYHGAGQANGLAFAVQSGVAVPPSLRNIFTEIASDVGCSARMSDGDLARWAAQGVLLLNATLTVRAGCPGSHQQRGWEQFTDVIVRRLSTDRKNLVFMLWGRYAQTKGAHIDRAKHLVLEASHPSPFSAHSGFFGCRHFSKANQYLADHGFEPIDWS